MLMDTAVFATLTLSGIGALVWLACSSFSAMKQGKDNLLGCLPFLEPQPNGRVIDAIVCGQLSQRHAPAQMCNVMTLARVVALGVTAGPSAIAGRVVAIHVDAVKRVSIRPRPHVCKEDGEIAGPFGAHRNSTPTVVREVWILGRKTSCLSLLPRLIFGCLYAVLGRAVLGNSTPRALNCSAPATGGLFRSQILNRNLSDVATVTNAAPIGDGAPLWCYFQHIPSTKSLSGKVKRLRHIETSIPQAVAA